MASVFSVYLQLTLCMSNEGFMSNALAPGMDEFGFEYG